MMFQSIIYNAWLSIRKNRVRSMMAGFGIAWGIFILIIFLGIGNGFKSGVMEMFNAYAQKSIFIYGGTVSIPTNRTNENAQVLFESTIIPQIKNRYHCIDNCSLEASMHSVAVSYKDRLLFTHITGVSSEYFEIKNLEMSTGEIFSRLDNINKLNSVVIGDGIEQTLFEKSSGIGKQISLGGVPYEVVGIISSDNLMSIQERNAIYIPIESYFADFKAERNVESFCLSISSNIDATDLEKDLKGYLAYKYGFDVHDEQALYIANIESQTKSFERLFRGLELLIWIIGVCMLLSGIISICNVMLIVVKERTNEIGIRKAVGASSSSIIQMIITESILITTIAGILGVVIGGLVVFLADRLILPSLSTTIISSVELNITVTVLALIILCISGVAAGFFPALKASQIAPVDAIRYENRG